MSLEMVADIWYASGDADVVGGAVCRRYKFTHDHWNLAGKPALAMRVFLAFQFTSQTCIRMINEVCADPENEFDLEDYKPMIKLLDAVDRLIDIMNGIPFSNGKDRNVHLISSSTDDHIVELFGILRLFEKWRVECGKKSDKFITIYTYEDLQWMVFGVAAVAALYLDEADAVMHQGRSGSDVCEHFFS